MGKKWKDNRRESSASPTKGTSNEIPLSTGPASNIKSENHAQPGTPRSSKPDTPTNVEADSPISSRSVSNTRAPRTTRSPHVGDPADQNTIDDTSSGGNAEEANTEWQDVEAPAAEQDTQNTTPVVEKVAEQTPKIDEKDLKFHAEGDTQGAAIKPSDPKASNEEIYPPIGEGDDDTTTELTILDLLGTTIKDVLEKAIKFVRYDTNHQMDFTGQTHHDFEDGMRSHYRNTNVETTEFADLFDSSTMLIEKAANLYGSASFPGGCRTLTTQQVVDLGKEVMAINSYKNDIDTERLSRAIMRMFRGHAKYNPLLVDDRLEADTESRGFFTLSPEELRASFGKAFSKLALGLLFGLSVAIFLIAVYFLIWTLLTRYFGIDTDSFFCHSATYLQDQLKLHESGMNTTITRYESTESIIKSLVDHTLRRTEKLSTDLQIMALTIWLSKTPLIRPLFRLLNLMSEKGTNATIERAYQHYFRELAKFPVVDMEPYITELNSSLKDLDKGLNHLESAAHGGFLDVSKVIFKENLRLDINPTISNQLHTFNTFVHNATEEFIIHLNHELMQHNSTISDTYQYRDVQEKPLYEQISAIQNAAGRLRSAKKQALVARQVLELANNGTLSGARLAVADLGNQILDME